MAPWRTAALVVLCVPSVLCAQRRESLAAGLVNRPAPVSPTGGIAAPQVLAPSQAPAPLSAWSILSSAVIPGTGQAAQGTVRALAYFAVEAFAVSALVKHSADYRNRRDGYRDLAARVARAPFSSVHPHGDFAYYERMSHYREAGRYDVIGGGGLDPETDTLTYNGAMWLLARRTYWSDPDAAPAAGTPEWERAIAFYRSRAYDQLYRWSWTDAPDEFAMFLGLIDRSNAANRRAMMDLGLLIANHVLSTVDAYISVRLMRQEARHGYAVAAQVPIPSFFRGSSSR